MLKITRRPYTSCPYLWELEVAGISVGEGECSEAQCEELNGTHLLTYRPCASKGQKLVWETDCEPSCGSTPRTCGESRYSLTVSGVTGPGDIPLVNGTFVLSAELPLRPRCHTEPVIGNVCVYRSSEQMTSCDGTVGPVWYLGQELTRFGQPGGWYLIAGIGAGIGGISGGGSQDTIYILVSGERCFLGDLSFDFGSTGCVGSTGWPATITLTDNGGDDCVTGPEVGDATRGKFRLEYDIPTETFTLHSFERVLYPKWTLVDSDPCTGFTKTLLLTDKGDSADGCGVAPAEMTITRVCPPDRVGKSALLEDRKPNGATGKRKRQCGCDCLDEVDDRRFDCATKCESAATEGCENIDPSPDDITCRYPEAINCCATTAGKDVPCAYTVEFECDLFFDDGESVRHKIAAKQVVLRRECYFEDPCLFVAAGPESSTGGSPVMDVDGFPGAQPVCASCADPCLTGCTWSAWTVAECPTSGSCEPFCDFCWTVPVGPITLNGILAYAGGTLTLTPLSSHYSTTGPLIPAETGYSIYAQVKVTGCEVSAIIAIESTIDVCDNRPGLPMNYEFHYGDVGGIGSCNPQRLTVCPNVITIVSCGDDGVSTFGCVSSMTGTAPLSLTFTKVDCP